MKRFIILIALLWAWPVFAQAPAPPPGTVFPVDGPPQPNPAVVFAAFTNTVPDVPLPIADLSEPVRVGFYFSRDAIGGRTKAQMDQWVADMIRVRNQSSANGNPNQPFHWESAGWWIINQDKGATGSADYSYMYSQMSSTSGFIYQTLEQTCGDLGQYITNNGDWCGLGTMSVSCKTCGGTWVSAACTVSNLSTPHEIGHNQGMNHDPANAGCGTLVLKPSGQMGCPSGYGYGHAWPIGAVTKRDMMAYPGAGGTRMADESNPDNFDNGVPKGIPDERDNARVERERWPIIQNLRSYCNNALPIPVAHQ